MRDHQLEEAEGIRLSNPVYDPAVVNRYLSRLNVYLDGTDMARNDAFEQRRPTDGPGEQSYEEYLSHIMFELMAEFGLSDDQAMEIVAASVADLVLQGILTPLPDDQDVADDIAYTLWVGQAKTVQLGAVIRVALIE